MKTCEHCNQEIKEKQIENISFLVEHVNSYEYNYEIDIDKVLEDYKDIDYFKSEMTSYLQENADNDYHEDVSEELEKYILSSDYSSHFEDTNVSPC